jgi:hypothetical protein
VRKSTKFAVFTGVMAAAVTSVPMAVAWIAFGVIGGLALRKRENSEDVRNIVAGLPPDTLKVLGDRFLGK